MKSNFNKWEREDAEFFPKRKVNNKSSYIFHHVIGCFYSDLMKITVDYESLGENTFCSILEMDKHVLRYYVQPVEVKIPYIDNNGMRGFWTHVPDILVFRQNERPHLYQIKGGKNEEIELSTKISNILSTCSKYSHNRGWKFSISHPKKLSLVKASNVKFLIGFTKPRKGFEILIPKLVAKLEQDRESSINALARDLDYGSNYLEVLPAIYHLIATSIFEIDFNKPINLSSRVRIFDENNYMNLLLEEGVADEV